jgi:[acyl-carrier-protein] S-malonyltransferase
VLAIIAPGQGSQTPGMLSAWLEDAALKTLAQEFSDAIGLDVVRLGTTADADEIKDTANAQPLMGERDHISFVAGHSVGEITAAALAGVISSIDAMTLVRMRGVEMAKAAAITPAGMAAVLGGDRQVVLSAIQALGLVAANDNGGGQIVAAGDLNALAQLAPDGARVRSLAVAGAFHTSYMQSAVDPLRTLADSIFTNTPIVGVISNKDGDVIKDGHDVLQRIIAQIANPVRWDLCMQTLLSQGVTGVIEVAPAGTLVGLIKRATPTIEQFALKGPADIASARLFIAQHGGNNVRN